jgi:hypothetical protein
LCYASIMTVKIQRIEGLFIFFICIFAYFRLEGNWLLFILLLFLPDISMVGYLKNNKLGAFIYNLGHNLALPISLFIIGAIINYQLLMLLGLIFGAHIGLDRALGFGLKEKTGFKDTHLGKLK